MLCYGAARASAGTLWVLVASVLLAAWPGAEAGAKRAIGSQLERLIADSYSENRTGSWQCKPRRTGEHFFEFEPPELPLLQCVVTGHRKLGGGRKVPKQRVLRDADLYVVLRGAGKPRRATFACTVCERRWLPTRTSLERQQALRQCRYGGTVRGVPKSGHPLADGTVRGVHKGAHSLADGKARGVPGSEYSRLDGMRCYLATRKGCDRAYVWCHGACCRPEALFYYPQLQQDAGVGGQLLTAHEDHASSDSRRLLETLRQQLQTAPVYSPRKGGRGQGKSLGHALRDATPEQRRRFFMADG